MTQFFFFFFNVKISISQFDEKNTCCPDDGWASTKFYIDGEFRHLVWEVVG